MRSKNEDGSEKLDASIKVEYVKEDLVVQHIPFHNKTLKECLTNHVFWHISFMCWFSMAFPSFIKPSIKNYGQQYFNNDAALSAISTASYFVSSLAKLSWGFALDKLDFKTVYFIILSIQIFVCVTIQFVAPILACYAIWMLIIFLGEGGHFVIFPNICSAIYGSE